MTIDAHHAKEEGRGEGARGGQKLAAISYEKQHPDMEENLLRGRKESTAESKHQRDIADKKNSIK